MVLRMLIDGVKYDFNTDDNEDVTNDDTGGGSNSEGIRLTENNAKAIAEMLNKKFNNKG